MWSTSQSLFSFFSVLCTLVQAKPHANPQWHHRHSRGVAASPTSSTTTTTTSTSPTPSTPQSSGTTSDSSSPNIGILYDSTSDLSAFSGQVGFSVDWSPIPLSSSDNLDLGTFYPQLWTFQDSNHLNPWTNAAPSWPSGINLIGFNEPDMPGQSWMTPSTAISGWNYIAQYQSSKDAKISTPGVSNSVVSLGTIDGVANPAGQEWMSQFLSLAASNSPKYTFQAISMHWYGSSSLTVDENGAMLNEQAGAMIQLAEDNGIPEVWITEMGSGYDASTATEDCQFIQWLEGTFMKNASNSMITHYAYNEHLGTLLNGDSMTSSGSA
ncbi:hypothetical protein HO133_008589 [Letharia lupina]|uniref:Asl1-like glycosyl hydrolase catalytic domain-containing protein n=1 Tax=Letharia lupina TaxID=560253 RepID=A0A8H6CP83_9LECA|nr:uncharacterized protein HO133_008589 [Letharia lupina]KAF6227147.1 hypothetical protein HO133_008589 [Letharia lupina]